MHIADQLEMPVAASDVDHAGLGRGIGRSLAYTQRAKAIQTLSEQPGKEAGHVLYDKDGQREGRRDVGQDDFEGCGTAGGNPDDNDLWQMGGVRWRRPDFGWCGYDPSPGFGGKESEDFRKQLAGEGFHALAHAVLLAGLGDVIGCAAREGFNGDAGAARGE